MKVDLFRSLLVRPHVVLFAGMILILLPSAVGDTEGDEREIAAEKKDLGAAGGIVIEHMDYAEAPLTDVIRGIGDISGLNILAGDSVKGTVSARFQNVTVRDALESILATNGYGYLVQGNVVQVRPARDLGEDKVQTVTQVFILQYLDAIEVEESLKSIYGGGGGSSGGSSGGGQSISSNPGANAIIVNDTPARVSEIADLIARIDRKLKQVMIEARLVEVSYDFTQGLGVDWTTFRSSSPEDRVDVNLGNTSSAASGLMSQALQWQFGFVQDGVNVEAYIQAQEDLNDVRILANPRILALHNRMASINIIDELPYVESTIDEGTITQSVKYQETGITLDVTPRVNDEGYVTLRVRPSQRIAGPTIFLQNSSAFPVDERSAETELILKDGMTAVIGGLRRQSLEKVSRQVPLLGNIPVFGLLFKRTEDQKEETELLLFITPHIMGDEFTMTPHEEHRFSAIDNQMDTVARRQVEIEKQEELDRTRREAFGRQAKIRENQGQFRHTLGN